MTRTKTLPMARLLLMTACAALIPSVGQTEETFEKAKIMAGEMLYKEECRRRHASDADHASYGPPLENIIGRAAGSYPDYDYSVALEASGIVWTEAALRAWMEDNTGFLPGTKMRHVGIKDATVQEFILAYLRSITTRDGSKLAE